MAELSVNLTASIWSALGGAPDATKSLRFTAPGALPSAFAVTDLASASIACAALAIAELIDTRSTTARSVRVDRRLASFWFSSSIRPNGWSMAPAWDPIAGDYRTNDGWIRLHTNAPHHRAAAQRVLGAQNDKDGVASAVSRWAAADLETAIVQAGGCAAQMRSLAEWAAHPQGRAIATEPLARIETTTRGADRNWPIDPTRPLAGIRVLDLTRVLAGPVASRFLAGFGADVLRIDPPDWNEPGVVPEVTLGKRCARLDLKKPNDQTRFHLLLTQADVLLHGYRANALERLGYDASARAQLNLGLIDVSLNAYGWSGPWRDRRGFDSLVQMSAGIAHAGMRWKQTDRPFPLPVQALDHATGYLMAAAAVRGITQRLATGRGTNARLALARTAKLLTDVGDQQPSSAFAQETPADRQPAIERTPWGDAQRLSPPLSIDGTPMRWDLPACDLGSAEARWR
jgi:crotonobetainyl-CoA:carnitine CoA-transferase CaiB-like acyl-CoA transferase